MIEVLEYHNYTGSVEFSAEDGIFFGKVQGIKDLVSYEGVDLNDLTENFKEAVDDYLETKKLLNK